MIKFLENHRIISIILLLLIAVEIYYISSLSFGPGSGGISLIPIVYHFCVFFLFNTFLLASIKGKWRLKGKHFVFAFIISMIYSILDEVHQSFVPGRDAGLTDIMINSAGIFFSMIIYVVSRRKKKFNRDPLENPPFSEEGDENEHDQQPDPQRESYY